MNGRYGSTSYDARVPDATETVIRMHPDLVISTGDMVAGQQQPRLDGDWLDRMWLAFNLVVADPLQRDGIPFAVTPGNHDGSGFPEFALERGHFDAQWASRVPELEILEGSEWPRRYAARMGTLLLLAFDGTQPAALAESERRFIQRSLQNYGRSASATIVFSHLPMWPLAQGREQEILGDPVLLELLHHHGVDVYASGHHHAFFAGIDDVGMVHLGVGALGGNARRFSGRRQRQPYSFAILVIEDGIMNVTSRAAPDFTDEVPASGLPETVEGPLGTLRRIDGPIHLRR